MLITYSTLPVLSRWNPLGYCALVPTVGERLATLEAIARENRDKIDGLLDAIDGGDGIEWERSVRGRLHTIEQYVTSKKWLSEYAGRRVKRWHAVLLVVCGVITTVCSVIAALAAAGVV
jgi:hypothetical protein